MSELNASRRPASTAKVVRAVNRTRETVIAERTEVADTAKLRNKGLLGRDSLAPGEGLWIVPCESVHTFWMRFAIDLIYLDRRSRIRKLREAVPAWRLSACLTAFSILELPAGAIRSSKSEVGDQVEFAEPDVAAETSERRLIDGAGDE